MTKALSYSLLDLVPYINWSYFFYAWGFPFSSTPQDPAVESLYLDAKKIISDYSDTYKVHACFGLFEGCSDGDDIVVSLSFGDKVRIPFLRQQYFVGDGKPHLCWADFIAQEGVNGDHRFGAFATCVSKDMEMLYCDDEYLHLVVRTLCDRLAEAAAEKLHEDVRKIYWGYASWENLTPKELFAEKYVGCRPAIGYPSLPDQSLTFLLDRLINLSAIGMRLTSSGMMIPHAAVCGFMFSHPAAKHFSIGKIDEEQFLDYAMRRGLPISEMKKYLATNIL